MSKFLKIPEILRIKLFKFISLTIFIFIFNMILYIIFKDIILIKLGILVTVISIVRTSYLFYKLIKNKYIAISATCTNIILNKKYQEIILTDIDTYNEFTLFIEQKYRMKTGQSHILYLCEQDTKDIKMLAFEEII